MRLRLLWGLAAGAVFAVVLACGKASTGNEILVGEYGSLTGGIATFGISTRDGSQQAFDEINAGGGILGKKIRLMVEDDQSKPEEVGTIVTKLINQGHVTSMLGHVASSYSLAAAPICQANKIPMITPSSTNPRVTQIGDYIFRVCFMDNFQGAVMAKFAWDTLKAKRVAILVDIRNDYSVGLQGVFRDQFKSRGGQIVAEQSFSQGDSDFHAQLTQIKSTNPDAIYVPGYYTEVGTIAHQAKELGLNAPLLGGDGWDSPKLWEIGGTALNGCYFSDHYSTDDPSPIVQKFVTDYKKRYNNQLPDALAALAYDAAKILADAMTRAGSSTDTAKVRDAIAATKDYQGVTGKITIGPDRNAVKPAVVLKVENGKYVLVETIPPEAVKL
ncbi:MAG TPA: ABC transporter substrate-binding protein [Thermoanaerobaculia bacterium]|nr:ABC transporter substrate-binding protein [Thermoanaerobaculia bacterium]